MRWRILFPVLVLALAGVSWGAQDKFDTLTIGSQTYSNVIVLDKTRTDVFLRHASGAANFKVKDLDPEVLLRLGYDVKIEKKAAPNPVSEIQADPRVRELQEKLTREIEARIQQADPKVLIGILGGVFVLYLFFSYCCMLIVKKTGNEPGVLVWLPILKVFPLLRAAGMPAWWFLLCLLPVLNIVPYLVWCAKVAHARGKTFLTALCLMLPVTSALAFLYLAFSNGGGDGGSDSGSDDRSGRIKLS